MSDVQIMQSVARLVPEARACSTWAAATAHCWTCCSANAAAAATASRSTTPTCWPACAGVNVIQLNLDEGLAMFGDQSFDVVLQIDTLQHLRNAETMLRETARVGRIGIVAFPNFAHWPNR
jgi:deoxyribose-phosphate aldolase